MIIAEIKLKENIVEYILYIRQIQDIIRANDFDINKIDEIIINKYDVSFSKKQEMREWYSNLIISMKEQNIEKSGDLKFIRNIIEELEALHKVLLTDKSNYRHAELYRWARPNIETYKEISKMNSDNEIEISINALNSLLLLRLQKRDISVETLESMQTFSNLLANIALEYNKKNTPES